MRSPRWKRSNLRRMRTFCPSLNFGFLMALQFSKDTRNDSSEFFTWFGASLVTRLTLELLMSTNACNCSWYCSVLFWWRRLKIEALVALILLQQIPIWFHYKPNRDEFPIVDKSWQTQCKFSASIYPNIFRVWVIQASIHSRTEVAKLVDPV